jgi:hypothetical protein
VRGGVAATHKFREHPICASGGGGGVEARHKNEREGRSPRHSHKWGEGAHFAGAQRPQNERFRRKMHKWDAPQIHPANQQPPNLMQKQKNTRLGRANREINKAEVKQFGGLPLNGELHL